MKRFLNNLSTSRKLILSFGILVLLLATVVIVAYLSLADIANSEKKLYANNFQISLALEQVNTYQNFNRGRTLAMMQTPDKADQQSIEQTITTAAASLDNLLATLTNLNPDPAFQSQLQELKNEVDAYRATRQEEISLIYAGKVTEAQQMDSAVGADEFDKIQALEAAMAKDANSKTDQQLVTDQQTARSATGLFLAIAVIVVFLAIVLVAFLNQTIARPLTSITKVAAQIGEGNLTVNLPDVGRRDEIGALTSAFRQMIETLRRQTVDLSEAVGQLGSSASEILAATTQVATGTAESATSVNETTTTVEEVRQAAQLSAQKAQNVSESAQRVAEAGQNGQKAVEDTSSAMDRIREQMETITQTVVRLSEQSQSIGGIIASVTDLADQSNLLAVNAAIEAARAGEQGKGFAVVAQEIKSLAEQSKQATAQVRGILSEVQKATGNAVMATEQGSKAVQAGVTQASRAGEAIQVLTETSSVAVQTSIQIVTSSNQQVVGMDQIGIAMENINQAGSQTAASTKQMEIAARDLHTLGEKLKELVAQFKV